MKKFFYSKFFIGFLCFFLGYFTHNLFYRGELNTDFHGGPGAQRDERIPIDPTSLDHNRMLDAMTRMERDMKASTAAIHQLSGVKRREDDMFVYFDVPLNEREKDHELKVSVKDGIISIAENTPNSQSERQFSIDPGLDETKADVQTLNDRISIKIPKLKE